MLVRGAIGNLAVKAIAVTMAFFIQIVLARMLGAENFGIYVYAFTLVSLLMILSDMGFSQASMRFIAVYNGEKEWMLLKGFLQYTNKIVFATAVLIALLCAFGVWVIREKLSAEFFYTLLIAIAGLPILSLLQMKEGWLIGFKRVIRAEIPRTILQPSVFCAGIVIAILWFKIDFTAATAMSISIIAAVIALIVASFLFYKIRPGEVSIVEASFNSREWFNVARAMLLIAVLYQLILYRLGIIMVGVIRGPKEAGFYVVASNIAGLLTLVSAAVNSSFGPAIADIYAKGNHKELQHLVMKASRLVLFASSLLFAVFLVFGKRILDFYGGEFYSVYSALAVLLCAHILIALSGQIGLLFSITGRHNMVVRFLLVGLFLNAALNMAFIPNYGALGASMATAFTALYWYIAMAVNMRKRFDILPFPLRLKIE